MRLLLELGADANALCGGTTPLAPLADLFRSRVARLLLRHGADPLLPVHPERDNQSFLVRVAKLPSSAECAALVLAHLERLRAAGQLELGNAARAAQLLLGAALCSHRRLLNHGLRCLEAHLAAASGVPLTDQEAGVLNDILHAGIAGSGTKPEASLQALLASSLPFNLAEVDMFGCSWLHGAALAAHGCAAKVRLLHEAGAQPTALDLLLLVENPSPSAVAALLSLGRPVLDVSAPTAQNDPHAYTCPIHQALLAHVSASVCCWDSRTACSP